MVVPMPFASQSGRGSFRERNQLIADTARQDTKRDVEEEVFGDPSR